MAAKKRKIWAFANTPFQVICVAELCSHIRELKKSDSPEAHLLIIGTPRANTTQSSRNLASSFSLEHSVLRLPFWIPTGVTSLVYLLVCRWRLREARPGDIVIVGNAMHHRYVDLLARSEGLERWSVDDGTASIQLLRMYEQFGNPLRNVVWDKGFYRFITRYLFRVKDPDWRQINWFTIFQPEFRNISNVVHNQLLRSKRTDTAKSVKKEIWFMGSALINSGLVSPEVFDRLLTQISSRMRMDYPEHVLRYILHPDEELQLKTYRNAYEGFDECVYFGEPIEGHIASSDSVPAIIASIMSTSILTLRELLPKESTAKIFLLNISDISEKHIEHVRPILDFLQDASISRGIEVIPLPSMARN